MPTKYGPIFVGKISIACFGHVHKLFIWFRHRPIKMSLFVGSENADTKPTK